MLDALQRCRIVEVFETSDSARANELLEKEGWILLNCVFVGEIKYILGRITNHKKTERID